MKITITLIDEDRGSVRIQCNPSLQKIIENYQRYRKDNVEPPASLIYAVLAIKKMQGDSDQIETEQERQRQEDLMRSQLILPGNLPGMQRGPTQVN